MHIVHNVLFVYTFQLQNGACCSLSTLLNKECYSNTFRGASAACAMVPKMLTRLDCLDPDPKQTENADSAGLTRFSIRPRAPDAIFYLTHPLRT